MWKKTQSLTFAFILLPFAFCLSGFSASGIVKGRVELTNARSKSRQGRVDASGVVIWLNPIDGSPRAAMKQKKSITQRNKRFIPHIVAVETGSEVGFPNEDPFFHNVFSIYNGKRFDLGLYASGETRPVFFSRPGISYIFCNIHPHMSAVVVTLDTPYFGMTDENGDFMISNLPEGRYQLGVWHERAKPETLAGLTRVVQIKNAANDLGTITVSEEGFIPRPHPNKYGQDYDRAGDRPGYRRP